MDKSFDFPGPYEVDVLMPVREPAPWLRETLNGLSAQTFTNFRLVAVIHGEDTVTSNVIQSLNSPSLVLRVPSEFSLADVLNFGLEHCSAQYVARLDSDDIPVSNRLELQRNFLSMNPKCAAIGTGSLLINEESFPLSKRLVPTDASVVLRKMRWKNVLIHPSVMFQRSSVARIGGYSRKAVHTEDYDLWLRLLAEEEVLNPEPLLKYRIHPSQVTKTKAIPRGGRKAILESRLNLARSRNESLLMARFRHFLWSTRQLPRYLRWELFK
jgi:glycosyltransferase involved in cell wall biosynthesis